MKVAAVVDGQTYYVSAITRNRIVDYMIWAKNTSSDSGDDSMSIGCEVARRYNKWVTDAINEKYDTAVWLLSVAGVIKYDADANWFWVDL